jgi:hypothetical protein
MYLHLLFIPSSASATSLNPKMASGSCTCTLTFYPKPQQARCCHGSFAKHLANRTHRIKMSRQITIDQVDTRWPYRAGYPRLLRLPVETEYIELENTKLFTEANLTELRSRGSDILEAHGIDLDGRLELAYQKHEIDAAVARTTGSTSRNVPRIVASCIYEKDSSSSSTTWAKAVVEIYALIQSLAEPGTEEIGVELIDDGYIGLYRFCEPPSDSARQLQENWDAGEAYHQQILDLFENYPDMYQVMMPIGVRTMDQYADDDHKLVLFFDALNAEDDVWDVLEPKIKAILPKDVGIEIRQAVNRLLCYSVVGKELCDSSFYPENYERPLQPGSRVGIQGDSTRFGTMGGYVVTKAKDDKSTAFAVTNAHVVLPCEFQNINDCAT